MSNQDEEKVLGKGIDAIFRRTTRIRDSREQTVTFENGQITRNGREITIRLSFKPHEDIKTRLLNLVTMADKGTFDSLMDIASLKERALKVAREGLMLQQHDRFEDAYQAYSRALSILEDARIRFNTALVLDQLERQPEARDEYQRVMKLLPNSAIVFNNYGELCFRMGDMDEAMQAYDKMIQLNPKLASCDTERMFARRIGPVKI